MHFQWFLMRTFAREQLVTRTVLDLGQDLRPSARGQAPGTCAQVLLSQRSSAACLSETGPLSEGGKHVSACEML